MQHGDSFRKPCASRLSLARRERKSEQSSHMLGDPPAQWHCSCSGVRAADLRLRSLVSWGLGHWRASQALELYASNQTAGYLLQLALVCGKTGSVQFAALKKRVLPQCGAPQFHLILFFLQPVCVFTLRLKILCKMDCHFSLFVQNWSNGVLTHHGASWAVDLQWAVTMPPSSLFNGEESNITYNQHCSLPSTRQ